MSNVIPINRPFTADQHEAIARPYVYRRDEFAATTTAIAALTETVRTRPERNSDFIKRRLDREFKIFIDNQPD